MLGLLVDLRLFLRNFLFEGREDAVKLLVEVGDFLVFFLQLLFEVGVFAKEALDFVEQLVVEFFFVGFERL